MRREFLKNDDFQNPRIEKPVEFEIKDYDTAIKNSQHLQIVRENPTPDPEVPTQSKNHWMKPPSRKAQKFLEPSKTWSRISMGRHGNAQKHTDRDSELEKLEFTKRKNTRTIGTTRFQRRTSKQRRKIVQIRFISLTVRKTPKKIYVNILY